MDSNLTTDQALKRRHGVRCVAEQGHVRHPNRLERVAVVQITNTEPALISML